MLKRILAVMVLLLPLNAIAVHFPAGIDWTNPRPGNFIQSLYLNVLGRAPSRQESEAQIRNLRRNDNRTARLRVFETMLESSEYRRAFPGQGNWRVYRAPDYNYQTQYGQRGDGFWRYKASVNAPEGFQNLAGNSRRVFSESVARSVAHYYDAFCYSGETCIDNPELARDRNPGAGFTSTTAHVCADPTSQTQQFKWVAVNGTTYPRGPNRNTICLQDYYYQTSQLTLQRYDCDSGFTNCQRNHQLDLRATRSGNDNSGNASLFFRDGSRLVLLDAGSTTNNAGVTTNSNNNAVLHGNSHQCADSSKTTSRFLWEGSRRTTSRGVGSNIICMDNFYYTVEGLTLVHHQCQRGFTDCRVNSRNNLQAERRTRVNGNAGLLFPDGSTVSITSRGTVARDTTREPISNNTNNTNNSGVPPRNTAARTSYRGSDCADPTLRVSQFRWKSDGLSRWPDGVDGRFICQSNAYYEITRNQLSHYVCQSNYRNCRANPGKDLRVTEVNSDGTIRTLSNGDQVTLISK